MESCSVCHRPDTASWRVPSPAFAAFLEVDRLSYHVCLDLAGPADAVCLGRVDLLFISIFGHGHPLSGAISDPAVCLFGLFGHADLAVSDHVEPPFNIAYHRAYLPFSLAGTWAAFEANQVDRTRTSRRRKHPHPLRWKSVSTAAVWEVT